MIVGNQLGVQSDGPLQGNSIGVSLDGHALPNVTGAKAGLGAFCDNLISNNQVGIQTTSAKEALLAGGNRIGTDASGTSAAGNGIGVAGAVVSVATADCPGTGPDLISGNTEAGVAGSLTIQLSDVYIGTDISGTRAIPNGAGIVQVAQVSSGGVLQGLGGYIGEGRQVLGGAGGSAPCPSPCVIVAGNTGIGISAAANTDFANTFTIQNSFIGVGAAGEPLGNGGDGVHLNLGVAADLRLGSQLSNAAGIFGNVIANNGGIGLDLLDVSGAPLGYPIRDNTVSANTGGGILLANGANFFLSGNNIHDNPFGVKVASGTAPELVGNSFSNNGLGYQVVLGTAAPGAPAGLTAQRIGGTLVIAGSRPAGTTGPYRIDVYGDAACTTSAQGSTYLSSVTVPSSLFSTDFSVQVTGVPTSTTGIEVAATDITSATATTPGMTGRYTGCVTPTLSTQQAAVSSTTVAAGSTVTVTGSGFAPGEPVDVSLHSNPVHLAVVTADANGNVSASVTIPPSTTAGLHHIVLTGGKTAATADVAIIVTSNSTTLASTGDDPAPLLELGLLIALSGLLLTRRRKARTS